jgi:hypothetical protein
MLRNASFRIPELGSRRVALACPLVPRGGRRAQARRAGAKRTNFFLHKRLLISALVDHSWGNANFQYRKQHVLNNWKPWYWVKGGPFPIYKLCKVYGAGASHLLSRYNSPDHHLR